MRDCTRAPTTITPREPVSTRTGPTRSDSQPPTGRIATASSTNPAMRFAASPTEPLLQRLAGTLRLSITWQASALYAVAFGGYVAFSVYLPTYLKTGYGLTQAACLAM
ncbi:hypothetical protein PBV88_54215, partial [Streptomyces sp. T21Q-yed]|nr:hypothetical protein [Streptomyces sp. T21Q-yed]